MLSQSIAELHIPSYRNMPFPVKRALRKKPQLRSDILVNTFVYLPRKDLAQLEEVSRKFRDLIQRNIQSVHVFESLSFVPQPLGYGENEKKAEPLVRLLLPNTRRDRAPVSVPGTSAQQAVQGSTPDVYPTYAKFISIAGNVSTSFANVRVAKLNITFSALNDEAWRIMKLAKGALNESRLEFRYSAGDFDSRASLRKYLDYVLLSFFNECKHFTLSGPHLSLAQFSSSTDPTQSLLESPVLREIPNLALSLSYGYTTLHIPTMITLSQLADWLEVNKAPTEVDWDCIAEKCLSVSNDSFQGIVQDLVSKMIEAFTAAKYRVRFRIFLCSGSMAEENTQPFQRQNDVTGETLKLMRPEEGGGWGLEAELMSSEPFKSEWILKRGPTVVPDQAPQLTRNN